ncbi:hypothetical protein BKA70DRAFT_1242686 [Coprinopsis sp. MPI-PUGE-AT-0042]|nr:hypothetical protein BKA70DRAFT_1242686 [Coprinopsis sp. MPI-PUGE-AT-0042]
MDEKSDVRPPKKAKNTTRELGPPAKSKILLPDQDPKKVKANPSLMPEGGYTFYDPLGKPVIWEPLFYGKDNKRFDDWASAIKANFCSGEPLHVSDAGKSLFLVIAEADYNALTVQERRNVWTKQRKLAIVQTNCQYSAAIEFNNTGMATLTGRIDVEIEVQDQSAERGSYATISAARSRRTTLQHLVEYSNIAIEKRPIVNALNLPLTPGLCPEQKFPFSSEYVAWMCTLGNSLCLDAYPTSHTRWSLVAFDGALHYLHINSDGFGTWVEVKHGAKLWVIARPKDGTFKNKDGTEEAIPSFGDINGFLKFFGHGENPNSEYWDVEAMVLKPGSRLIMAPNMIHAVWTMENSICYGRHFYSVATLLPTVVGVIHAFIGEAQLTNTQHSPSRFLLRRMVHFFHYTFVCQGGFTAESDDKEHLPSFDDPDMFASTFALLCFMELQNVLDFRSYTCPHNEISSIWYQVSTGSLTLCNVNTIPHEERLECIYTRGLAQDLASWVFTHYDIAPQTGPQAGEVMLDPWVGFYFPYLAHFMVAIDVYKASYPRSITKKFGVDLGLFCDQITHSIDGREELISARSAIDPDTIKSIAPPFTYSIVKREEPHEFLPDMPEELTANGYCGGDRIYIEAYKEALAYQAHRRRAEQSHR